MMNKEELIELLNKLEISVDEGIQKDKNANSYPRIVFWDYVWEPLTASDEKYTDKVFYQISFFSKVPRDKKLIELKKKLAEQKIYPIIEHEYIDKTKEWHSFFPIQVMENIE